MSRPLPRWRSRARQIGEQWSVWRRQWSVERALEDAVAGSGPILVGPWFSEVGHEVLYWVPFVRWVMAAYRVSPDRLVVMSRGGTATWYRGISSRYIEIFEHLSPADVSARTGGVLKQREIADVDRELIDAAQQKLALGRVQVLHPSLMFRWFEPFWSGHETLGFVERHTRYSRISPADCAVPIDLPAEYVAVKFYAARSLPDEPAVRTQVQAIVQALSERYPVVQLGTGLTFDDHSDYTVNADPALSLSGRLAASVNLEVQTEIIAGARLFVGTCGSLSWLAPMLGVDTIPVFADASLLHAHLHLARRVYDRVGGGRFAPLDISGVMTAGWRFGVADHLAAVPH